MCLSVCTEIYTLLCVYCLSVLNLHIAVCGLSLLNWTHCCDQSVCLYRTEKTAVCGLSVGTKFYALLCVDCLSVLNCTHRCVSVRLYWNIHIDVCSLYFSTETYTLLYVVRLSVPKFKHWVMCGLSVVTDSYTLLWVICLSVPNSTSGCMLSAFTVK